MTELTVGKSKVTFHSGILLSFSTQGQDKATSKALNHYCHFSKALRIPGSRIPNHWGDGRGWYLHRDRVKG